MRKLEGLKHNWSNIDMPIYLTFDSFIKVSFPVAAKIKYKSNCFDEFNIMRRAELALVNNRIGQCNQKISKPREEIKE